MGKSMVSGQDFPLNQSIEPLERLFFYSIFDAGWACTLSRSISDSIALKLYCSGFFAEFWTPKCWTKKSHRCFAAQECTARSGFTLACRELSPNSFSINAWWLVWTKVGVINKHEDLKAQATKIGMCYITVCWLCHIIYQESYQIISFFLSFMS